MSNIASPVWFITGCSTGFGRELAKRTIANGWPTVATARNKSAVADFVDGKDNAFAIDLDVTGAAQIAEAMIKITQVGNPPRHLVLGALAFEYATKILKGRVEEFEKWREMSLGAKFRAA
jgi:NADP-dependent 3-hydroxy acid dehydrogenase YdfG